MDARTHRDYFIRLLWQLSIEVSMKCSLIHSLVAICQYLLCLHKLFAIILMLNPSFVLMSLTKWIIIVNFTHLQKPSCLNLSKLCSPESPFELKKITLTM